MATSYRFYLFSCFYVNDSLDKQMNDRGYQFTEILCYIMTFRYRLKKQQILKEHFNEKEIDKMEKNRKVRDRPRLRHSHYDKQ